MHQKYMNDVYKQYEYMFLVDPENRIITDNILKYFHQYI